MATAKLAADRRFKIEGEGPAKAEIMHVAGEEFSSRGYEGTNLGVVAARLGVTRQALYHYFPRKQDILVEIFREHFDALEASVTQAVSTSPSGERFRKGIKALTTIVVSRPSLSRIFNQDEARLPADTRAMLRQRRRGLHGLLVRAYEEGVDAGKLMPFDAKLTVSILLGTSAWMHQWFRHGGRLSPEEMADYAVQVLFAGIEVRDR